MLAAIYLVDVDQTSEIRLPIVGVETKAVEMEVLTGMGLDSETKSFEMPTINIEQPEQDDPANN